MGNPMEGVKGYSQIHRGREWMAQFQGRSPLFACVLGFTETGLIPGISAAGATPADRQYTAIADAEFLYRGAQTSPQYPLPPLTAGASPVLITRAVLEQQQIPLYLFNAGLPVAPPVPAIDLAGTPAHCLSTGHALPRQTVEQLLQAGLEWGETLAQQVPQGYLTLAECVVGGTTTALAVLTGLGWQVSGMVNSSHPTCNHEQKWAIAQQGLSQAGLEQVPIGQIDPVTVVSAVGDPMQMVVAGMAIAASRSVGVLLAGGTQMLAVYALIEAIAHRYQYSWQPKQVVVGTTRWVADDPTGDTVGLATLLGAPLLATQLSFSESRYPTLQAYEQGYVKEGVGAGGCAIAAHLYQGWDQPTLLAAIEAQAAALQALQLQKN